MSCLKKQSPLKAKKISFWVADLETTRHDSVYFKQHGEPCISLCAGIYIDNAKASHRIVDVDFLAWLNQVLKLDPAKHIRIYYHNLGQFDGSYIVEYLATHGFVVSYDDKPTAEKWVSPFSADNGNTYIIRVGYNGRTISFEDSLKLLSVSIKELGRVQGIEKLDTDYCFEKYESLSDVPSQYLEYVMRDCEIMIQPLVDFYRVFNKVKLTAGSTSLQGLYENVTAKISNRIKASRFFGYLTNTNLKTASQMLKYCFGGLNFYNHDKVKQVIKGCYIYDATSFYPSQMALKPMIVSKTLREVPVDYVCAPDEVALVDIVINSVKNKDGRTDFYFFRNFNRQTERMAGTGSLNRSTYVKASKDTMFGYMFEHEFLEDLNWCDIDYYIERKYVYKTDYYMRDYINAMFENRRYYKLNNDSREQCFKIILNAIFGKLMENPLKLQMRYYGADKALKAGMEVDGVRLIRPKSADFNIRGYQAWVVQEINTPDIVRNPIIGGYITSLARTELKSIVRKYREHVIYGDTDSVVLTCKIPEFENGQSGLGSWKRELKEYEKLNIFVFGTKRYEIDNDAEVVKLAMCGANKEKFMALINQAIKDNPDKADALINLINKELKNMKLAKRMAGGKRYLVDSPYQIRDKDVKN